MFSGVYSDVDLFIQQPVRTAVMDRNNMMKPSKKTEQNAL
jgi:hypothetical protein